MSLHELAIEITLREGGKKSISIAQVKEVLRHLSDILLEEEHLRHELYKRLLAAAKKRKKK